MSSPFALGVYVGNPNAYSASEQAAFDANFKAFSSLMGTQPQYLDQFADQTLPISQWVSQAEWNAYSVAQSPLLKGITPVIALPMTSTASGSQSADDFYKAFASGAYDSVLKGMVKAWAENGFTDQIWRPGWEMNVSTMPSYAGSDAATQADWVKAYQHIYTVLHQAAAENNVHVEVMWNPTVANASAAGNAIQTTYPGNDYVDIIGADVYGDLYPYGDSAKLYDWDLSGKIFNSAKAVYTSLQKWASDPVNLEHYYSNPASSQWLLDSSSGTATTLQQLIDLAKSTGKPFAIAETGAGNTADGSGLADNPTFVKWLAQTLQQSGVDVKFVNIWDSNGGGTYAFSDASDGKPLEAAAWSQYFGAQGVDAPTLASFSPDSNVVGDGITNANHVTLTGTAAAGSTVQVFDGATQIGTATANASGAWSFATGTLVDGNHAFTSKAVNAAGHVSAASTALNVTVDTVAPTSPTVTAFSPDSNVVGDGTTNANHVTLTGTAVAGSTVQVFDGATQIGTATANASGAWSFATGTLADGNHAFTSKAMDAAGNVSGASAALKVTVDTVAPTAPTVTAFSPDSNVVGDGTTNANHVTLTGTAVAGSTVQVFDGATQIGTAIVAADGNWSFATGALTDGTHVFTSKAVDAAGNVSVVSGALKVAVDTVGPNAPILVSDSLTSGNKAVVSGTAEAGSTIKLYEGKTLLGTAVTASNGTWSVTTVSLADGAHAFTATATDAAGNVSVLSAVLDPIVGTLIDSIGNANLTQAVNRLWMSAGGTDVLLKSNGVAYVMGPGSTWKPIAVEATSSGFDVAWKNIFTGLYTVWTTDSNGNFTSNLLSNVSGTSASLQSIETLFHQDLNGDGVIGSHTQSAAAAPAASAGPADSSGAAAVATPGQIETAGTTSLTQVGTHLYLSQGGTEALLKYNGAAYVMGPTSTWMPIGAEATSTGYDVAWKNIFTGAYTVWTTDSNGNFTSNLLSNVSGTSASLKSIETVLHQDLNGDGVINTASTELDISGKVVLALSNMSQAVKIEAGATLELTGGVSGAITFASATGTLVLDHSTQFTGKIYGLTGDGTAAHSDILDLKDISFGAGTKVSYAGNTSGGVLTVSDAQNHVAKLALVGDYTHSTFNLSSDGNGGTLVIDPPMEGFKFTAASSQPTPSMPDNASDLHVQPSIQVPTDFHPDHNMQFGLDGVHLFALHDGFLLHA